MCRPISRRVVHATQKRLRCVIAMRVRQTTSKWRLRKLAAEPAPILKRIAEVGLTATFWYPRTLADARRYRLVFGHQTHHQTPSDRSGVRFSMLSWCPVPRCKRVNAVRIGGLRSMLFAGVKQSGCALQAGGSDLREYLLCFGYGGVSGEHVRDFARPEQVPGSIIQTS
jgi:hypothetical protein